jgi:hypothetical protein
MNHPRCRLKKIKARVNSVLGFACTLPGVFAPNEKIWDLFIYAEWREYFQGRNDVVTKIRKVKAEKGFLYR